MSGQPLAAHSQAEPTFQVLTVNAEHVESAVEVVPTHKDESQISGSMQETETTMAALECHEANTDTDACTDSTDRAQEKTAASSEQEAQLQTAAAAECTSSGLDAGSASSRQEAAAALCATQQFGSPTEEEPGTAGSGFTAEHESIAEDCGTEQRVPLNALPAHERKLSGGSSKSGNPYASSCGANRAGSAGGSPSGSMDGPEGSGALLQHELSGAVLAHLIFPLAWRCEYITDVVRSVQDPEDIHNISFCRVAHGPCNLKCDCVWKGLPLARSLAVLRCLHVTQFCPCCCREPFCAPGNPAFPAGEPFRGAWAPPCAFPLPAAR